jgi:hypothetical protein
MRTPSIHRVVEISRLELILTLTTQICQAVEQTHRSAFLKKNRNVTAQARRTAPDYAALHPGYAGFIANSDLFASRKIFRFARNYRSLTVIRTEERDLGRSQTACSKPRDRMLEFGQLQSESGFDGFTSAISEVKDYESVSTRHFLYCHCHARS